MTTRKDDSRSEHAPTGSFSLASAMAGLAVGSLLGKGSTKTESTTSSSSLDAVYLTTIMGAITELKVELASSSQDGDTATWITDTIAALETEKETIIEQASLTINELRSALTLSYSQDFASAYGISRIPKWVGGENDPRFIPNEFGFPVPHMLNGLKLLDLKYSPRFVSGTGAYDVGALASATTYGSISIRSPSDITPLSVPASVCHCLTAGMNASEVTLQYGVNSHWLYGKLRVKGMLVILDPRDSMTDMHSGKINMYYRYNTGSVYYNYFCGRQEITWLASNVFYVEGAIFATYGALFFYKDGMTGNPLPRIWGAAAVALDYSGELDSLTSSMVSDWVFTSNIPDIAGEGSQLMTLERARSNAGDFTWTQKLLGSAAAWSSVLVEEGQLTLEESYAALKAIA
jgi:hypothetical protein